MMKLLNNAFYDIARNEVTTSPEFDKKTFIKNFNDKNVFFLTDICF